MSLTIERMPIPESLDGPGGADFVEMVVVRNAIEAETSGLAEISPTAQDLLPYWQDAYSPQVLVVARVDGRIVGRATIDLGEEGATSVYLGVQVLPEHRRRGIGTALLESAETIGREAGRTIMQGDGMILPAPGPQLESPTGYGAIPADSAAARFAQHHGYALGQVVRGSRLPLPFDAALPPADEGYRVFAWEGAIPEDRLDDLAVLHARMATDAPSADLDVAPETWDADRVRALDELRAKTGTTMLTSAVEHVESGRLVAFSELSVPPDPALAVHQQDTLVLREHRGHRLGMLAKVANLELLGRAHPGHEWVITFNAEENRPMLDVNEAIGFVPFVYEAVWKKG